METKYKRYGVIIGVCIIIGSLIFYSYYREEKKEEQRYDEILELANLGIDAINDGDKEKADEYYTSLLQVDDFDIYGLDTVNRFFHKMESYSSLEYLSSFDLSGIEGYSESELDTKKDELEELYAKIYKTDPSYEQATNIYNEKLALINSRYDQIREVEEQKQALYDQNRGMIKLSETSNQTTYRICMNKYGTLRITGYFSSTSYYDSLNVTVYDQSNNIVGVYCNDEILPGDGFRFNFNQSYTLNDGIYTIVVTRSSSRVGWEITPYGNYN